MLLPLMLQSLCFDARARRYRETAIELATVLSDDAFAALFHQAAQCDEQAKALWAQATEGTVTL